MTSYKIKLGPDSILCALFALWLFCEALFEYSVISRITLLLFVGASVIITRRIPKSLYLKYYILLVVWSCLNIATGHSIAKANSIALTETLLINVVFLYALIAFFHYIDDPHKVISIFKKTMLVFSLPSLVAGLISAYQGRRLQLFGLNNITIAKLLAVTSVILLFELLQQKNSFEKTKRIVWLFICIAVIATSGARTGFITMAIGMYVVICFHNPKKVIPYSVLGLILVSAVLYLVLNVDVLYNVIGYRINNLLLLLQGKDYTEASLSTRFEMLEQAWIASKGSPVWGYGLDTFSTWRGVYSHSNFMELLYSLGWIGVALFYFPHVVSIFRIRRNMKAGNELSVLCLAFLVAFLVCDIFSMTYYTRKLLLIYAFVSDTLKDCTNRKGIIDKSV